MSQAPASVLKGSQVSIGGPCCLDGPPANQSDGRGAAASAPAAARIVEQDDTRAVVEVLCPCGNRIRLECRYAQPPASRPGGKAKAGE